MAEYPTKYDDITAGMTESPDLFKRTREARMASFQRCGYSDAVLARLLRTDEATIDCLHDGLLDTTSNALGVIKALPEIAYPNAAVRRLVIAYSKLLQLCGTLPARSVPEPVNESIPMSAGTCDAGRVASLRDGLRGFTMSNSGRNLNGLQRRQAFSSGDVTIADLAAAIDVETGCVWRWVAGLDSPPATDAAERYYRGLTYLAQGPVVGWSTSKAGRAGVAF